MQKITLLPKDSGKNNWLIDYVGLFFIGILSLGYLLFYSWFAKLHMYLFFLGAPFFIGDMVFVICCSLFLLKWFIGRSKINIFTYVILFYTGFVMVKTTLGYFCWGALSLRHSALFYYPLFALFSYSFYRNDFFEPKKFLFIFFILIFIFKFLAFHPYFALTCIGLSIIFINSYTNKTMRYFFLVLLIVVLPYKCLFDTSRTFIIANLFGLVYISFAVLVVLRIKRIYKLIFCLFILLFIYYGLSKISKLDELRSLIGLDKLVSLYNENMELRHTREPSFVEPKLSIKLFNEENVSIKKFVKKQEKKRTKSSYSARDLSVVTKDVISNLNAEYDMGKEKSGFNNEVKQAENKAVKQSDAVTPNKTIEQTDRATIKKAFKGSEKLYEAEKTYEMREVDTIVTDNRPIEVSYANSLFRIFIWKDAFEEFRTARPHPIFGFDFGKPFRSRTLEILRWAESEWKRDGWICFHNSYIDIVYRAGAAGILMIAYILILIFSLIRKAFLKRSLTGILLTGILITWFIAANFSEILEMPYTAIPLWSLFGLTYAYLFEKGLNENLNYS